VDFDEAMDLPRDKVMIIATGGQGEPMAALSRIAFGNHPIKLSAGDLVVFSSKQIPGNEIAIGRIQNQLAEAGIDMITDRQALIHVSGHPGRPELAAMYGWLKPKIVVPVHGEMRHMMEHARVARSEGVPNTVVPKNGTAIRLAPGKPEIVSHETVGRLVLDGDVILPADGGTINARRKIAVNGYMGVTVIYGADGRVYTPVVTAQGVPVEDERDAFLDEVCEKVSLAARDSKLSEDRLRENIRLAARRVATAWTGKKPIVEVSMTVLG